MANNRTQAVTTRFSTTEIDTGQKWVDGKTIYRKVINFGALPNGVSKSMAHGITNLDFIIFSYLTAKTGAGFRRQFVEGNLSSSGVDMGIDNSTVNFYTTWDFSNYPDSFWVIEYTKT